MTRQTRAPTGERRFGGCPCFPLLFLLPSCSPVKILRGYACSRAAFLAERSIHHAIQMQLS